MAAAKRVSRPRHIKKTCPVCNCLFPATRRITAGEDPSCCTFKCSSIKQMQARPADTPGLLEEFVILDDDPN